VTEAVGVVEVDYSTVDRVRAAHRARWETREGFAMSRVPFVARAVVDAIDAVPVLNASRRADDGGLVLHRSVDLGVDDAFVADAGSMRLRGIARALAVPGGTTRRPTLALASSRLPGILTPALVPPAVGALGIGAVRRRPVVVALPDGGDAVGIRSVGLLTLVYDRRVVGTPEASKFLDHVRGALEARDWATEL
jgi:2-oxoglutarate dehydrogenase E2 component (dihydrolipoamide succinyltransferase)